MSEPLLSVHGLSKSFAGLQALSEITLSVGEGEAVGLIGPNGSGKTTLLNVVTGYYRPDRGQVRLRGRRVDGLAPYDIARLGLARTFQLPKLARNLTVWDNLMIPAHAHGTAGEAADAEGLLDDLGLAEYRREVSGELPMGLQRMLEVAVSFVARPKAVLLDEPFAGLSPDLVERLRTQLRRRQAQGVSFMVVSHDIPAIADLCTRLVVLNAGRLIADGPTDEVLADRAVIEVYLGEDYGGVA